MRVFSILIFLLAFGFKLSAQIDFQNLSAEDIIRIGKEELVEASKDIVFIELMDKGHELFKSKNYDAAIQHYSQAQKKRPQNVYPSVIIRDIELEKANQERKATQEAQKEADRQKRNEALMQEQLARRQQLLARQQENKNITEAEKEQLKTPQRLSVVQEQTLLAEKDIIEIEEEEEAIKTPVEQTKEQGKLVPEQKRDKTVEEPKKIEESKKLEQKKPTVTPAVNDKSTAPKIASKESTTSTVILEDSYKEEVIKQENKTILRRTIIKNNTITIFEEVKHNWGGVYWFKDGKSITESEFAKDSKQ
ncbi:MAG: hypothetical protein ACXITV_13250 [Luteibaculaceae bacterium]